MKTIIQDKIFPRTIEGTRTDNNSRTKEAISVDIYFKVSPTYIQLEVGNCNPSTEGQSPNICPH